MKPLPLFLGLFLLFSLPLYAASNDDSAPATPSVETSPTPEPTPASEKKAARPTKESGVLLLHKPMPSPSWGKVVQYHREEIFPLSDKNREILHEFLFQDDNGVVRTAVFHENSSGDGYWEVTVWDLP